MTKKQWKKFKEAFLEICLKIWVFVLDRMLEPSTLRGLVMAMVGLGVYIAPGKMESIIVIGTLAVGILGAITPDTWRKKAQTQAPTDNKGA